MGRFQGGLRRVPEGSRSLGNVGATARAEFAAPPLLGCVKGLFFPGGWFKGKPRGRCSDNGCMILTLA